MELEGNYCALLVSQLAFDYAIVYRWIVQLGNNAITQMFYIRSEVPSCSSRVLTGCLSTY